jgi:O-antigen/teichoic acid export membrane protein
MGMCLRSTPVDNLDSRTVTTLSAPLETAATDLRDVKQKSVRGGTITFLSQGLNLLLRLVSTVVLARLLSPADYGLMAMVAVITSFAGLFRDLGLSSAAIQQRTLSKAQQSNLFWVNVAVGSALTAAVALAAPLVSRFYNNPQVLWITVSLSTTFLITSLGSQSGALFVRDLRFGRQAVASISGAVLSLLVAVVLALRGFGYWSLVGGELASAVTSTTLLFVLSPFRPGAPTRGTGLKKMLAFGANVTGFNLVNYFARNLDNLLIGRYWGAAPLGIYSRAYSLLMFPIQYVRAPINAVAFPALSRLQNDPAAYRTYYLRVTSLLAILSMPLTAYLYAASEQVIEVLMGRQWLGVVPVFSYLAVAAFIQPSSGLCGSLMLSLGRGQRYFQVGLFNSAVICAGFVVGLRFGPSGVALAYAITVYLVLYPSLSWSFRDSPICVRDFVRTCTFPATVSLISAASVLLLRSQVAAFAPIVQLGAFFLVFLVVIGLSVFLTATGREYVSVFRGLVEALKGPTAQRP